MKASALLILLLLPSLALAQQSYYGTTAASVSLPPPADPAHAALLSVQSGDVITTENIRSSIQALYDTGHYREISVDAEAGPEGRTRVSFLVTTQYYFSTFLLEPDDLLERPITSYFQPPLGKQFSKAPVERLIVDTIKLIEEAGYFNVTLTPEYTYDARTHLVKVVLKTDADKKRAKIRSIQIQGGDPILSDRELRNALGIQDGSDFNGDKLSKGLVRVRQKFVDKGYLTAKIPPPVRKYDPATNTVELEIEIDPGKTTIVQVLEEGNVKSDISETRLRALVPIYEEGTVDSDLVEEGRQHIVDYYRQQGYFDASAIATLAPSTDQSVRVDYIVTKGEQYRVHSIQVAGSAFFSESEILKTMKNREGRSSNHGLFSPELLNADVRAIGLMYQNAGFRSTTVTPQTKKSADRDIDITITIDEGLRSSLDSITFTGNLAFTEPELWRAAGIQADQVYSAASIDNARSAVAALYYSHGFSEVRIESPTVFNSEFKTVDVRFDIIEGPQFQIGEVHVAGNTHTAEKIITRTSDLKFKDPYNPETILEAQQRLYALGIFNRVDIVTIDQDRGEYKNILIQVEDAKPVLLTPGLGITEHDGPRVTIELTNINLFGLSRTFSIRARGGRRERQLQTSYRDPRLFNHDLLGIASLTFDKTEHVNAEFTSNQVDVSLQIVRKLSKTQTLSLSASYETVNLEDTTLNPNIRRFPVTKGLIQIGRLGTSFIEDRRDSVSDPTHGRFISSNLQVANKIFGSEVNFISLFTQGNYYTPLRGGVIATSVRAGWKHPYGGDIVLPISERFFVGGSTTLRGFPLDDAGPPEGGQLLTIANIEYRIPLNFLPLKGMGGAAFYDTGNVFERPADFALAQFTHTIGTGLRYKTPIGPVRVDVGFNLRAKSGERPYRVFFTLGHAF